MKTFQFQARINRGGAEYTAGLLEAAAAKLRAGCTCDYNPPEVGDASFYWELSDDGEDPK